MKRVLTTINQVLLLIIFYEGFIFRSKNDNHVFGVVENVMAGICCRQVIHNVSKLVWKICFGVMATIRLENVGLGPSIDILKVWLEETILKIEVVFHRL